MKPIKVTVTEVARNFSDYINRVAYRGERFHVTRGNKAVVELNPLPGGRSLGDLPDLIESLPKLTLDEAKSFTDDLDIARREMSTEPISDPWE